MKILDAGYKNYIAAEKITAVINYDTKPAQHLARVAKEEKRYIDATHSRKTRSVIVTDKYIIGSAVDPATIRERLRDEN